MAPAGVSPVSRRAATVLGVAMLASLAAAGWLLLSPGDNAGVPSVAADGYSVSALGHSVLLRGLRNLGEPIVQMRMARDLDPCGLLVFAEPRDVGARDEKRLEAWADAAAATMLVLPKRVAEPDPARPEWLATTGLVDVAEAAAAFRAVPGFDAGHPEVVRIDAVQGWRSPIGLPVPTVSGPVQLLAPDDELEPWIECDDGVLLGVLRDVVVMSDPDVIANHGIHRGANAELALAVFERARGKGAIVFDETLHGVRIEPSLWHALGRFPLVLVPVHLLLLAALVAWMANGRFGAALAPAPALGAGKAFLIDNVAALLRRGTSPLHALHRYRHLCVRRAAEVLHAPASSTYAQQCELVLARIRDASRRAQVARLLRDTESDVDVSQVVALARAIRVATAEVCDAGR